MKTEYRKVKILLNSLPFWVRFALHTTNLRLALAHYLSFTLRYLNKMSWMTRSFKISALFSRFRVYLWTSVCVIICESSESDTLCEKEIKCLRDRLWNGILIILENLLWVWINQWVIFLGLCDVRLFVSHTKNIILS